MNIKDVEKTTEITKQNIRFYEKQGLIHPSRNPENDYREYSEEDIRTLKLIKILRKLQMPIEQIKLVINSEVHLEDALHSHLDKLQKEQEQLNAVISFCHNLEKEHSDIHTMDIDSKLDEMDRQEKAGFKFGDILHDFMTVIRLEEQKHFSFSPDTMIGTPREFTNELLKYAADNNLDICITKESMYPEFTIDGLEFSAARYFSRFGAIVSCTMKHPELVEPDGISRKQQKIYRIAWTLLFPMLLFFFIMFSCLTRTNGIRQVLLLIGVVLIITIIISISWWFSHPRD